VTREKAAAMRPAVEGDAVDEDLVTPLPGLSEPAKSLLRGTRDP
jgi:hypothetical protein